MKNLLLFILAFPLVANATQGMITVLEAPVFGEPDENSKVIQYYRKGDAIYLHPSESFEDRYIDEEFKSLELLTADENPDPFLNKEQVYISDQSSKFYKTLARSGREAYILKEHVYIEYKDIREFNQEVIGFDHTDYRIEEPLPKGYPIIEKENFRGQVTLSFGQPNYEAYPYSQRVIDSAYGLAKEFSFVWSKAKNIDAKRRFFFGAKADLHFSQMNYLLTAQKATQDNTRITVGPYASYDTYRTVKHALNLYTSLQFIVLDQMDVTIKDNRTDVKEQRQYNSNLGFTGNLGGNFQFFKFYKDFDAVVGANFRTILPRTYSAREKGSESGLWQSIDAGDEFKQEFTTELSYFVGVQTYY